MPERISTYIIASIFATILIVSGVLVLSDIAATNPSVIPPDELERFNNSFNIQENLDEKVGGLRSNIENADPQFGAFGGINALATVAWNGFQTLFASFDFIGNAIDSLSSYFGIPPIIPTLLGLVVIVIFAFAIYSAIMQRDL